ncbi:hypothetical protein SERLA73DRAFT_184018, partial [Serpula lacrymans var. lacrymans S7.3]
MYFNTTVTNTSPLLLYVPQTLWFEAPPNDTMLSNYATQSYHANNSSLGQASVSFSFTGTGIWLFGGYRSRLGPYEVNLDGKRHEFPGYQYGTEQLADAMLFGQRNLSSGSHYIEMTNTSNDTQRDVLDIDYVCSSIRCTSLA